MTSLSHTRAPPQLPALPPARLEHTPSAPPALSHCAAFFRPDALRAVRADSAKSVRPPTRQRRLGQLPFADGRLAVGGVKHLLFDHDRPGQTQQLAGSRTARDLLQLASRAQSLVRLAHD